MLKQRSSIRKGIIIVKIYVGVFVTVKYGALKENNKGRYMMKYFNPQSSITEKLKLIGRGLDLQLLIVNMKQIYISY